MCVAIETCGLRLTVHSPAVHSRAFDRGLRGGAAALPAAERPALGGAYGRRPDASGPARQGGSTPRHGHHHDGEPRAYGAPQVTSRFTCVWRESVLGSSYPWGPLRMSGMRFSSSPGRACCPAPWCMRSGARCAARSGFRSSAGPSRAHRTSVPTAVRAMTTETRHPRHKRDGT
jgi:hypothetical protein